MAAERKAVFAFLGEDRSLGKTLRHMGKEADTAHGHFSNLQKAVVGFGAALAGGVAAKKIFDFGKSSVDAYTSAAKAAGSLQRVIGGTVEDASRLSFAAHETGVASEDLTKGLLKFAKATVGAGGQFSEFENKVKDAAAHHKTFGGHLGANAAAFAKLGVNVKDARGNLLPMGTLLADVADQFKAMPNGAVKTAYALQLFGRGGAALLPMLNKGKDGIKEFAAEADKLGLTMSGKDVAAVKAYTMQQRHMKASFEGLKITLGRSLFPIFTAWSDRLAKDTPKIVAWAKDHLPALQHGFHEVSRVIGGLLTAGEGLAKDIQPFFQYIGKHPKLFATIAKDAAILAVSMKAISLAKGAAGAVSGVAGLGGRLLRGGKGGAGAGVGGALGVQKVYVVNMGPGGLGGGPGGAPPVVASKPSLAKKLPFLPVGGTVIGSILLTSGDSPTTVKSGDLQKLLSQAIARQGGRQAPSDVWSQYKKAIGPGYSKSGTRTSQDVNALATLQFLQKYADKSKAANAAISQLAHNPGVVRALHEQATAAAKSERAVQNLISGGLLPLGGAVRGIPKTIPITLSVHTRLDALGRKLISSGGGNFYTQGRAGRLSGPSNVQGATGGIVTRPTMALIGEAGPEMVVPLNRTAGSRALPAGVDGAAVVVNINVNGPVNGTAGMRDLAKNLAEPIRVELASASRRGRELGFY